MRDPENGDYQPESGSDAVGYGCLTFGGSRKEPSYLDPVLSAQAESYSTTTMTPEGSLIEAGGVITDATTWDADIVRVTSAVEIAPGGSLFITPGTEVKFEGFLKILVRGRLWAVGTPNEKITFSAEDPLASGLDRYWDGIEFFNVAATEDSSRISFCTFRDALADTNLPPQTPIHGGLAAPGAGGALSIVNTRQLTVSTSEFFNNRAKYGACIYVGYHSTPVIAGNLFFKNEATISGSAMYISYSFPQVINNTIVENSTLVESSFFKAAAVECYNSKPVFINNLIRDNSTNHYSGMQILHNKEYCTTTNNIQFYSGGSGNIDTNPEFLANGSFPYSLTANSSCLDIGQTAAALRYLPDSDLAGNQRLYSGIIDLGAFEYAGHLVPVPEQLTSSIKPVVRCYPNPFNPQTNVNFSLPGTSSVNLGVYNLQGRLVRQLADRTYGPGNHSIRWNGTDTQNRAVPSGVYFLKLLSHYGDVVNKAILVR